MIARPILRLAALVLPVLTVGSITGLLTTAAVPTWYAEPNKPSFNPPNWLFAPVWPVLYVLTGAAGGQMWSQDRSVQRDQAMSAWVRQLVLNGVWTVLFFGLRSPLVGIMASWWVIRWCMTRFQQVHPWAQHLLRAYPA